MHLPKATARALQLFLMLSILCALGEGQDIENLSLEKNNHDQAKRMADYGTLPLTFEPNRGQANLDVSFVARSDGHAVLLRSTSFSVVIPSGSRGNDRASHEARATILDFKLLGVHSASPEPFDQLTGVSNYLIGNDSRRWLTRIPNFAGIRYRQIYSGIDLLFHGKQRHVENDFVVYPNGDYRKIRVKVLGGKIALSSEGDLQFSTTNGDLKFEKPEIYQNIAGRKVPVEGGFRIVNSSQIGFSIGRYRRDLPLVIDPVLSYSTYVAGSTYEHGNGIAIDSTGNAYITGLTFSADFPVRAAYQSVCKSCGNSSPDVFVTKLNSTGTGLIYSTYLGGSNYDEAFGVSVDKSGNAVVVGRTQSSDFPTKNPIQSFPGGNIPYGFVSSFGPTGILNYSTYFGQTVEGVVAVTTDQNGNAYVTGRTYSSVFPFSPATVIGGLPGYPEYDIFVAKITSVGKISFTTLIGPTTTSGPPPDLKSTAITVDSAGNSYITGSASSFPVTTGAYNTSASSAAILAKLNPTGTALVYATYLGGPSDVGTGIAVDPTLNAYLVGTTSSANFPITPGAFQTSLPSGIVGSFVTKFNPSASALSYSTYLSGPSAAGSTYANGIALDKSNNAYVVGTTTSSYFPLKNPISSQPPPFGTFSGFTFVSKLNNLGSALLFSTFFAGSTGSQGSAIAVDGTGNAYIAGTTFDTDLPTTAGAFMRSISPPPPFIQPNHAFATKFGLGTPAPSACLSTWNVGFGPVPIHTASFPAALVVKNCGNANLTIGALSVTNTDFSVTNGCTSVVAPGLSCTLTLRFTPSTSNFEQAVLRISDNAPVQPLNIPLSGKGAVPIVQVLANVVVLDDQLVGNTSRPQLIVVQNIGDADLQISSVTISGDFAQSNNCNVAVTPGNSCYINVAFTPTAAGLRSGTLTIKDNAAGSPQTVQAQGTGLTAYPVPQIVSLYPSSAKVGSASFTLTVSGAKFFQPSVIRINGVNHPTTYSGETQLSTTLTPADLATMQQLNVQVFTTTPGGGASNVVPFIVYRNMPLNARDLVFDPFTRGLYLSTASTASSHPNALLSVNPSTAALVSAVPVGNSPNQLAISDDGRFLYVGLDGDYAVRQYNVATRAVGPAMSLGVDPVSSKKFQAYDIKVLPGNATSFVVSLLRPGTSPFEGGVSLFANGLQTSQLLSGFSNQISADKVQFLSSPSTFYGGDGYNFYTFEISSQVVSLQNEISTPIGPHWWLESDGKYLYTNTGKVYDPVANKVTGAYTFPFSVFELSVLPDRSAGRTFFLDNLNNGNLYAYDQTSFAQVGSAGLPFSDSGLRLVRWGRDGFAYLAYNYATSSSDLILFRSNLVYPSRGPNPIPAISLLSPASVSFHHANFYLTVNGSNFVRGAVVLWNGSDRTTTFISPTQLRAAISAADVNNPGTPKVTVWNPAPAGGTSSAVSFTTFGPVVKLSPPSLVFSGQLVGTSSAPLNVTLTNSGNAALGITGISTSGDFAIVPSPATTCGTSLAPALSCTIAVVFKPTTTGPRTGALAIKDNANGSPQSVPLSGNGQ